MAIIFKKVRFKNFLSIGDKFTEIDLTTAASTLVIGKNGSGKSAMLIDPITYALFGKPYRNIRIPQLVNSINQKNMLVEIEFSVGSNEYLVRRGKSPSVFDIIKNGKPYDQSAKKLDHQKILEEDILKLNQRAFQQIVVLGSANFIPFMQLKASSRREVIEELLDIRVFSGMKNIVKKRIQERKGTIHDIDMMVSSLNDQITLQNTHIQEIDQMLKSSELDHKDEIKRCLKSIEKHESNKKIILEAVPEDSSTTLKKKESNHRQLVSVKGSIDSSYNRLERDLDFYQKNDVCPTCSQRLEAAHKQKHISECEEKRSRLQEGQEKAEERLSEIEREIRVLKEEIKDRNDKLSQIRSIESLIAREKQSLASIKKKLTQTNDTSKLEDMRELLSSLYSKREAQHKSKESERQELTYDEALHEMFKDTGIKTRVIRHYIPVMNKLINQYLEILDFFVLFTLDENFNETIRSRHRDDFTYDSFSEGEKSRIDIALLLTWREIARMKNSAHTNLLILDETLDQSLDAEGIDNLMGILEQMMGDSNIFVISHRAVNRGSFERVLEVQKVKNFSQIKEISE